MDLMDEKDASHHKPAMIRLSALSYCANITGSFD